MTNKQQTTKEGIFYKDVWYKDNEEGMRKLTKEILKNNYAHIIDKNAPKVKIESITTTMCPLCEKRAKESLSKTATENQARVDKYGLGEDMEDDKLYLKAQKEFRLKFKCPCYEYDEHACKFNKVSECPFNIKVKKDNNV